MHYVTAKYSTLSTRTLVLLLVMLAGWSVLALVWYNEQASDNRHLPPKYLHDMMFRPQLVKSSPELLFSFECPIHDGQNEWRQMRKAWSTITRMSQHSDDDLSSETSIDELLMKLEAVAKRRKTLNSSKTIPKYSVRYKSILLNNTTELGKLKVVIEEKVEGKFTQGGTTFQLMLGGHDDYRKTLCPVRDLQNGVYTSCCTVWNFGKMNPDGAYQVDVFSKHHDYKAYLLQYCTGRIDGVESEEILELIDSTSLGFHADKSTSSRTIALSTMRQAGESDNKDIETDHVENHKEFHYEREHVHNKTSLVVKQVPMCEGKRNSKDLVNSYTTSLMEEKMVFLPSRRCVQHHITNEESHVCINTLYGDSVTILGNTTYTRELLHFASLGAKDSEQQHIKDLSSCESLVQELHAYVSRKTKANSKALLVIDASAVISHKDNIHQYISCVERVLPRLYMIEARGDTNIIWADLSITYNLSPARWVESGWGDEVMMGGAYYACDVLGHRGVQCVSVVGSKYRALPDSDYVSDAVQQTAHYACDNR